MSDVRGRVPTALLRLGQRADELDERLLHIDAEVLPHAFGLSFELRAAQPVGGLSLRRLPEHRARRE